MESAKAHFRANGELPFRFGWLVSLTPPLHKKQVMGWQLSTAALSLSCLSPHVMAYNLITLSNAIKPALEAKCTTNCTRCIPQWPRELINQD